MILLIFYGEKWSKKGSRGRGEGRVTVTCWRWTAGTSLPIRVLKVYSCKLKKTLINDNLTISKVSWKFSIPTIYNFAVVYLWNLLFLKKAAYFLTLSIVFSVYKQNFTSQELKNLNSHECKNFIVCYLCWSDHVLLLLLLLYNVHDITFKYYHINHPSDMNVSSFRWLKKDYTCEALTLTFSEIFWSKDSYL